MKAGQNRAAKRYLLDTNICIYIAKANPPTVLKRFEKLLPEQLAMSVITWGELQFGAHKSTAKQQAVQSLETLRGLIEVLPLPEQAGQAYGQIRANLQTRGEMIGNNDLWIAAHAVSARLTVVTNNLREFARVEGLRLENWV